MAWRSSSIGLGSTVTVRTGRVSGAFTVGRSQAPSHAAQATTKTPQLRCIISLPGEDSNPVGNSCNEWLVRLIQDHALCPSLGWVVRPYSLSGSIWLGFR